MHLKYIRYRLFRLQLIDFEMHAMNIIKKKTLTTIKIYNMNIYGYSGVYFWYIYENHQFNSFYINILSLTNCFLL